MRNTTRGLLAPTADPTKANADGIKRGFVRHTGALLQSDGTRITIDTEHKSLATPAATDTVYTLAGHSFALTRALDTNATATPGAGTRQQDFGKWRIPTLDTGLTSTQASTTASGAVAPWNEGAQVWLSAPNYTDAIYLGAGGPGNTGAIGTFNPTTPSRSTAAWCRAQMAATPGARAAPLACTDRSSPQMLRASMIG